jgi:hypothetical protein
MKTIDDYLVETTIGDIKDGRPIRMYYQGTGDANDKKVSLMIKPMFSEPIDGEVEALCYDQDRFFNVYTFSPNPVDPMIPIRFDRKDAIACDVYIKIEESDSDSDSFNINAFGFGIHSDGITLCGSLHPTTTLNLFDSRIASIRDLWIKGITDPITDDLDWKLYGDDHLIRNIPIVSGIIESAWNFLKGDKPIWELRDRYVIINETTIQIWKTVIGMILNSEYTMLHQQLLNDYVSELEHLLDGMEKYEQGRTGGYLNITSMRRISANDPAVSVAFRLDFFNILEECNKLELLRQIPLDARLKMIQLFNKLNKHEVVALLNHYHKGDYKSLDTMEGWEL